MKILSKSIKNGVKWRRRGAEVGIAGTATLYVSDRTGVPQSLMAFSRGIGMITGPLVTSKILGRLKLGAVGSRSDMAIDLRIWSGESQYCFGFILASRPSES